MRCSLAVPQYAFPLGALELGGPFEAQLFHSMAPRHTENQVWEKLIEYHFRDELGCRQLFLAEVNSVEMVAPVWAGTAGSDLTLLTEQERCFGPD